MSELRQATLTPDQLLLDPNNFRFQDNEGYVTAAEERFHEDTVQQRAYERLRRDENLIDLKRSIIRNGYVPVERLVVRPYRRNGKNKYVVIEGNRRLAAAKWVLDDVAAGLEIEPNVLASIETLPVVIAEEDAIDEVFRASLMGIRHVAGIKQWGGYQRAKLIASMRDDLHLDAGEVAERLGLSAQEVNRRYRAFKALNQMQKDEEYEAYANPTLYPLFHEAVSLPVVKNWLDWNENDYEFKNSDTLHEFYSLITPSIDDDGKDSPPKINTYAQVRDLKSILVKPDAKRALLDPHRDFQEAQAVAKQEELSHMWAIEVADAIKALSTMGIQDLKNLTPEDVVLIEKLRDLAHERVSDHRVLLGL